MFKIIALIGEAGSGKDSIMKRVLAIEPSLHEIISCTSREPRENEIEITNDNYEEFLTNSYLDVTKPRKENVEREENKLDFENLINEAYEKIEKITIRSK